MEGKEELTQSIAHKLEHVIEKYVEEQGYDTYNISYGTTARNFCSVAKLTTIHATKDDQDITEHLFVKTLTDSQVRNERLKLSGKFERESFMYNAVFKEFQEMQQHVSRNEKFPLIKCIRAESDSIILEDLTKQNYEDVSRNKTLDLDHLTIMLRELAKFHAFSFALKQRNSARFQDLIKDFNDIFVASHRVQTVLEKCWQFAVDAIADENVKNRLIKNGKRVLDGAITQSSPSRYGVICHGDYNLRNVLFKYNQARKPCEMIMIDFQLSHYSSPVRDIFFMVSSSMSTELRTEHYQNLLEVYFNSLSNFLTSLGCHVDTCYPKEEFKNDFVEHFPSAFANSLVVLRVLCSPEKSDESIDKIYDNPDGTGSIFNYNSTDAEREYTERINGLIFHFITLNYI